MSTEYRLDVSLAKETAASLDLFTRGYIEAAMWTLTDENGESCDHLGLHDIAPETIEKAREECRVFQETHREVLDLINRNYGRDDAQHGHDYWLTRNGHGAGFWDRGYSAPLSRRLTDAAQADGGVDWYLGDDGLVYQG